MTKGEIDPDRAYFSYRQGVNGIVYSCSADRFHPDLNKGFPLSISSLYSPDIHPKDETKIITYIISNVDAKERVEDIYLVDIKNKQTKILIEFGLVPLWSPDGQYIVFNRPDKKLFEDADLYIANADGTGIEKITNTANITHRYTWFSSDVIFFSRWQSKIINGKEYKAFTDIWKINRDGTGLEKITKSEDGVYYLVFWAGNLDNDI